MPEFFLILCLLLVCWTYELQFLHCYEFESSTETNCFCENTVWTTLQVVAVYLLKFTIFMFQLLRSGRWMCMTVLKQWVSVGETLWQRDLVVVSVLLQLLITVWVNNKKMLLHKILLKHWEFYTRAHLHAYNYKLYMRTHTFIECNGPGVELRTVD